MGIETRGSFKCYDIKLVGIFQRDLGFVGDRLGHSTCTVQTAFEAFVETWGVKYDKATECLI
jgi:hypothetical protein